MNVREKKLKELEARIENACQSLKILLDQYDTLLGDNWAEKHIVGAVEDIISELEVFLGLHGW